MKDLIKIALTTLWVICLCFPSIRAEFTDGEEFILNGWG